ncbi:MAG: peptide deformylase [Gammaproteobacteria bacterium]|nr:peptide deformylase [Gammaproteobacteria bacterium]NIN62968.1 peptide deformylase [Gammaproteobacteria bacterium]NIO63949.1 peptide deformylase [Gammaproteobacteria bacterium]NIP50327.1 peptide deformylase [Gammaproteobacteria bacterium]NIQ12547.1 peptide deformylase [Gammaproteobacteria bacterium]
MALLNVLHFPNPRLRLKAKPVGTVDDTINTLAKDMLDTMYAEGGIGLAATQVDVQKRVIVIDLSEHRDDPMCLINPEIIELEGTEQMQEGCLSVPGYYDLVERAEKIRFRYLDLEGQAVEANAEGLLAVCIQHEIDHLDGKLFIDYLSPLKQQRLRKKLEKQERLERQQVQVL